MKTQFLVLWLMHFWIIVCNTEDNSDDQREDDISEEEILNIIERATMQVFFPTQEEVGKKKSISQSQKILKHLKNDKDKEENHQRHLEAAEKQSQKVMERLAADMLFGYNGPQNVKAAVSLYKLLAEEGSHRSQTALGFLSSYGIGVEYNQAKALVYYTFASIGGNLISQMIMGYRYWLGINVPKNCEAALTNYKKVAKFVANKLEKNEDLPVERVRLMERPEYLSINEEFLDWDLYQFLKFLAERGNTRIQIYLGQLHLMGRKGLEKDHAKAFYYFLKAANAGNAYGMAFIGKMYLKGSTVVTQSNITALKFFTMAADKGNSVGLWGLGILYLKGRGVPLNYTEAFQYFQKAAEKGYDNAQFQLGVMYYDGLGVRKDFKLAFKYFYLAFDNGHLLAMYYLAQMYAEGTGVFKSCQNAVELYKTVCELGGWSEMFRTAYFAYQTGNIDSSLVQYAYLAEMGYEEAQINSVYIMESEKVKLLHRNQVYPLALLLLKQAASQGNAFARVKIGDYYFYGFGTTKDYVSAVTYYALAANQLSAEAMFNLAYMHEHGLGVPQDIHLARRWYDLAAETTPDAVMPVFLAYVKLETMHVLTYLPLLNLTAVWKLTTFDDLLTVHWDLLMIIFLLVILLRANQQN
ncbi:protein sel-1 homolog 2 [Ahaetulla prasina]|uniref:protein sel-1 homolog 2 n=1 Tax=Ahaetulla prasina TaxID=499056 RepID=UPI0026491F61|nr:protein sel-1 homolog 2 [Ahaetulla prasina]